MTVKQPKETQDLAGEFELRRKFNVFMLPEISMDQPGGRAGKKEVVSEEDSPRSVGSWRRRSNAVEKAGYLHSQVLRIREEESLLGEDISEGLNGKYRIVSGGVLGQSLKLRRVASAVDVVFFSRPPVLPFSPLSGMTAAAAAAAKTLHCKNLVESLKLKD